MIIMRENGRIIACKSIDNKMLTWENSLLLYIVIGLSIR